MKTSFISMLGIVCAGQLLAQESTAIDSKVIHRYFYVDLSLGCVPAHGDLPALAGAGLSGSFEWRNCLLWLSLGTFVDTGDAVFGTDMSRASGGVGYVIRLDQNRINIIPRLGASYLEISNGDLLEERTTLVQTTAISPSITFSYAFNNRFSVDAGYALEVAVDSGSNVSQSNLGATFAFAKRWGVRLEGTIASDQNYNGIYTGIASHF